MANVRWHAIVLVGATLGLVMATGASVEANAADSTPSAKPAGCGAGRVAIRVNGKRSCRPLAECAAATPQGRRATQRAAEVARGRRGQRADVRGRRPPTLKALLADFGPNAYPLAKRSLPQALGIVDRLSPRAFRTPQSLGGIAAVHASDDPCIAAGQGALPKSEQRSTAIAGGNGAKLDLTVKVGKTISMGLGFEGKAKDGSDRTVRLDIDFDMCKKNTSFDGPNCPTAAGKLVAKSETNATLTITTLRDGEVEYQQSVEIQHTTTLEGKVGEDAKLEYVDVEDDERMVVRSARVNILWGPSTVAERIQRKTRIDMRTERYDPGRASVDVAVQFSGVLSVFVNDAERQANLAEQARRASDESFAKLMQSVIKHYRELETKWNVPNTCAKLRFDPASNTLRLRSGQTGSFTAKVVAPDGKAAVGRWALTSQRNGTFTPRTERGQEPTFRYRVANGSRPVNAGFRATSPAGVAADTWTQGQEELPARFSGAFSGTTSDAALKLTWSGTVTYVRDRTVRTPGIAFYKVASVQYTAKAVGTLGPCSGSATGSATGKDLTTTSSGLSIGLDQVSGRGHRYLIALSHLRPEPAQMTLDCGSVEQVLPWQVAAFITGGEGFLVDGRPLRGSNRAGAFTAEWNLRGSG